jgi:DNA primase
MYYCFSTSQGGDMFSFVQTMEGVDFKESLKILAQKAGVELVAEDPKKKTERERWYAALTDATAFYVESLAAEPSAITYLEQRGVKKETIQKWQIGFAPGPPKYGWRMVKDALETKGYTKDELMKTGIIKTTEGGKEPFDVFRDRIMFPMPDQNGKVVAFSGRILSKDTDAPKYVNSPETELYKKSELLYGYDKAKHGIRTFNFSLIVEGQFDVVMAHQAGYNNTVAVSGTALTTHHVQLLERLSDRVVLALDADRAGIAAMKRAAELMLKRGIDVKVAEMPLGKDPADIIKADAAEFKHIVGKSVHVIEFLLHVLCREETEERTLKRRARAEILPFVLLLPDRIDQEHFTTVVATAIGSTTDAVRYEVDRLREQAKNAPEQRSAINETVTKLAGTKESNKADVIKANRVYLEAATQIVKPSLAAFVRSALDALLDDTTEALEPSELARAMFENEQLFAKLPDLVVDEEVVAKLNQLRTGLIRQTLATQKQLLVEAEQSQNETLFNEAIASIKTCEEQLRLPPYKWDAVL